MVEPIGHVPVKEFETMVSVAEEVGFEVDERPRIRLSRAVVLRKPQV